MGNRNKSSVDYTSLGCCTLAFVLYMNTLNADFVYDDRRAILGNKDVSNREPWIEAFFNDYWGTPLADTGSHGSYRPLCILSFRVNYIFGGYTPWGYHLINNLMHCLATGLVVKVARQLLSSVWGVWATGALFAAHPVHTEAVAGIVGRADIAACIFYLLTYLVFIKHIKLREKNDNRQWLTLILTIFLSICGLLFKETAVTALIACAIFDIISGLCGSSDKNRCRTLGILAASLITIIFMRLSVPGPKEAFSKADNPIAKINSIWTRFLTLIYLPVFNFKILLNPNILSFDWGMDALPQITTLNDARNLLSLIFYITIITIIWQCIKILTHQKKFPRVAQQRKSRTKKKFINVNQLDIIQNSMSAAFVITKNDCICRICKQGLTIRHTSSCRAINNNNNVPGSLTECGCLTERNHQIHSRFNTPIIIQHTKLKYARDIIKDFYRYINVNNSISVDNRNNILNNLKPELSNGIVVIMSMVFLMLPFLPATNLFFYVGFVVAERLLYLPSVGFCLLVGFGISKMLETQKQQKPTKKYFAIILCIGLVLSVFSMKTWKRNNDWKDEESLFRSAIRINPPKALGNLGSVLSSQGRYTEAEKVLRAALKFRPNMADVHFNLGILYQNLQKYKNAVESFQKAIHFRPSLALAYLNLGMSLISLGRCQEAAVALQEGTRVDGRGVRDRMAHENARMSSYLQLGNLYAEQGKLQRALAVYREAIYSISSNYQREILYNRIGDIFGRLQQWDEAEKFHRAALDIQPNNVGAQVSYGATLAQNSSRASEAELWFKKAIMQAPLQASVHHHYAEFLASYSRFKEACYYRVRAAELSSKDYALVVSAATALRLLDRKVEAERWYRKAIQLRPDDPRAHTNLGAILHLLGFHEKAAASYKEALRLQPGDPTTLGNLAKLGIVET